MWLRVGMHGLLLLAGRLVICNRSGESFPSPEEDWAGAETVVRWIRITLRSASPGAQR